MDFDGFVTFCATDDLAATARFYEHVVGLDLALDQGTCRIYRVTPTAFVGFCARDDAPKPDGVILTLLTPEVDEVCDALCRRGAVIEKPPAFNPRYQIRHAFLRDPNGYLIEIQRFEDPAWRGP